MSCPVLPCRITISDHPGTIAFFFGVPAVRSGRVHASRRPRHAGGLRDAIGWSAGRIRVGARPIEANSNARHLRSCSFHLHHVTLLAGPMHGRAAK